ncbi:hypothetical protein QYE76_061172 [Lolium multiflorum]|uniref:Zinc knuckle CX2CX4HX4C domain-containing protein n=1 Tax=Lolium multiflorum TaxID=4521 RepID=A0AAD8W782_LOLMU|nr:hypothetical protein QYE76_061172 [Lolium multiflorum]
MEKVEGLLQNLKLSEAERKGLRLGSDGGKCKESGKRKALDDGPWKFNNDLLVMADFDPNKSLEEYEFDTIPIWLRVRKLPLGRMNRSTGEAIGDEVGEFVQVDVGADDMAIGEYLRVKVKLNIKEPLKRGLMIHIEGCQVARWCPFEYEFLPEFCYTCGIIGHEDKICSLKLARGEKQQFGPWLRAWMPKRSSQGERKSWEGKGGNNSWGFGFTNRSGGSGSDSRSWRVEGASGDGAKAPEKGDEATSPLKKLPDSCVKGNQKQLVYPEENGSILVALEKNVSGEKGSEKLELGGEKEGVEMTNMAQGLGATRWLGGGKNKGSGNGGQSERIIKKFKRKDKQERGKKSGEICSIPMVMAGSKRGAEPMEIEEEKGIKEGKKLRSSKTVVEAGLSVQPCKDQ